MDPDAVIAEDDAEQRALDEGRRYRARQYSDVVLFDLDWDEEPADEAPLRDAAGELKMRSA